MAKYDMSPFGGGIRYRDVQVGMRVCTRTGLATVIYKGKSDNPVIALLDIVRIQYDYPPYMQEGAFVSEIDDIHFADIASEASPEDEAERESPYPLIEDWVVESEDEYLDFYKI